MQLTVLFVLVLFVSGALPMHAQSDPVMERILIPTLLPPEGIAGSFGSLWTTRFRIRNNAEHAVLVREYDYGCRFGSCPATPPTSPQITFSTPQTHSAPPTYGLFMFVEQAFIGEVSFSLHVQDQTRQGIHHGTRIPIVRDHEFRRVVRLLDVPTAGEFRSLIRLYSPEAGRVRIRYFQSDPLNTQPFPPRENVILTQELDLEKPPPPKVQELLPATAVVATFPDSPTGRVVMEIEALSPEMRVWAYASVTHNDTQHVTIIAP